MARKQSPRQSHAELQDDVEFIAQYILETSGRAGNAVRKGELDRASNLFAEVNNTLRMIEKKGISKTADTIRMQTVLDDLEEDDTYDD